MLVDHVLHFFCCTYGIFWCDTILSLQIFALCIVLEEDESKLVVLLFGANEGCKYMNSILNYSIGELCFLDQITGLL